MYCAFCTRSYAIGAPTESVKKRSFIPARRRWDEAFEYIEGNPDVNDVVVSGGDSFYLDPNQLMYIGQRLLQIPHVKRFRLASKGLAVCPMRLIDQNDGWADCLIQLSKEGRQKGKEVALHTHFNHPNEMTWVTSLATRKLFREGVTVRNQTVLLRGVNDNVPTMSKLIRELSNLQITPYYVYQADMVKGVEDMRTPLSTILELEEQIRCSIAGFMLPRFVVDLPGGGGKVPALSYKTYDRGTGVSTFRSPLVPDRVFMYHDPLKRELGQCNS